MSFKYKILSWNFAAFVISFVISILIGVFSFERLAFRFFGARMELDGILMSPVARPFMNQLLLIISISFLISFLICNIIVYMNITKSIRPLNTLKEGVLDIAAGNGAHYFTVESKDEIGQIMAALNEMQGRLKQQSESLVKTQQHNMELISSISHDLRTPITTIIGYVDGILDGVANTEEKKEKYMHKIKGKALDMESLISQLLYVSKLDYKMTYRFEKTDVVAFIEEIVEEIKIDLINNHMIIIMEDETNISFVSLDRERFKRVVLNILNNSFRYKKEGSSQIKIRFQNAGRSVVISFEDNGIGIAKEKLPLIFNSFYRCDDSRGDAGSASGLGLAICKMIVEGHSGKIWAKSQLGQGTTIFISIGI